MARQPDLPRWMVAPGSDLERRLAAMQDGERAVVRRSRLRDDAPEHGPVQVEALHVQSYRGRPSLLSVQRWAEYGMEQYEGNGAFVAEDYLLTVYAFVDDPADEPGLIAEAEGRIAVEEAGYAAELGAIQDAVRNAFAPPETASERSKPGAPATAAEREAVRRRMAGRRADARRSGLGR